MNNGKNITEQNDDKKFLGIDEQVDNEKNRTANNNTEDQAEEATAPLSTQGDDQENEENLGGSTNLSLDQLKENHDGE